MEYSLCKASVEEEEKVEKFIHDNFMPDMPLIQSFAMDNSLPPQHQQSPPQRPPLGSEDFIVKAVDGQGELIGVAINKLNPKIHKDQDSPPDIVKVAEFLQFAEENAELDKLPERTIELRVLSVSKQWRQRGVARRLAEESMRLAREAGFPAMRVCCTSEYTARLVRSLGWREHYRLAHKDYPRLSGRDVSMKHIPPHEHLYYYVTDLV